MSYFKNTYAFTDAGFMALKNYISSLSNAVITKNHTVAMSSSTAEFLITSTFSNMAYSLTAPRAGSYSEGYWRTFSDSLRSGTMGKNVAATFQYGETAFSAVEAFTLYRDDGENATVLTWTDSDNNDYSFHIYDNTTTHYASVATNNPDIAVTNPSFTFPVVKDFDLRTAVNSLNGGSDKYIIQPLVAFGMKTPIFLITGANGADVPLFSEIEAQGKSYFVIGSNYCVEM